jgi:muconolactone delta-isomerase
MLFLIIVEIKGAIPFPIEEYLQRVIRELEICLMYQKKGNILAGGQLSGRKGMCAIVKAESNEELFRLTSLFPFFHYAEWQIHPLTDFESALKYMKKITAVEKISKSKNNKPA